MHMGHHAHGSSCTWVIRHMGHQAHGASCTWGIRHMGHHAHGSSGTWVIRHMGHQAHGSSGTWVIMHMGHHAHGASGTWVIRHMGHQAQVSCILHKRMRPGGVKCEDILYRVPRLLPIKLSRTSFHHGLIVRRSGELGCGSRSNKCCWACSDG
jgi:hypothetical protein